MASALDIAVSSLKNFQIDQSIIAGGAGAIATVAIGAVLVALNVTVPVLGIPLTMTMVTSAAIPVGHVISALVPATADQQINALATRLGLEAQHIKNFIPQMKATPFTPNFAVMPPAQGQVNSNINQG